jgi:hypothetical protein
LPPVWGWSIAALRLKLVEKNACEIFHDEATFPSFQAQCRV